MELRKERERMTDTERILEAIGKLQSKVESLERGQQENAKMMKAALHWLEMTDAKIDGLHVKSATTEAVRKVRQDVADSLREAASKIA